MTGNEEREVMRRMGSRGGKRAAASMTPTQRRARALKASRAAARKRGKEARHGKN